MLGKIEGREVTEDEMVGWYHQLNGHEFKQTLGDSEGRGSLECCSPWGSKESDKTEQLKNSPKLSIRYNQCQNHIESVNLSKVNICNGAKFSESYFAISSSLNIERALKTWPGLIPTSGEVCSGLDIEAKQRNRERPKVLNQHICWLQPPKAASPERKWRRPETKG